MLERLPQAEDEYGWDRQLSARVRVSKRGLTLNFSQFGSFQSAPDRVSRRSRVVLAAASGILIAISALALMLNSTLGPIDGGLKSLGFDDIMATAPAQPPLPEVSDAGPQTEKRLTASANTSLPVEKPADSAIQLASVQSDDSAVTATPGIADMANADNPAEIVDAAAVTAPQPAAVQPEHTPVVITPGGATQAVLVMAAPDGGLRIQPLGLKPVDGSSHVLWQVGDGGAIRFLTTLGTEPVRLTGEQARAGARFFVTMEVDTAQHIQPTGPVIMTGTAFAD